MGGIASKSLATPDCGSVAQSGRASRPQPIRGAFGSLDTRPSRLGKRYSHYSGAARAKQNAAWVTRNWAAQSVCFFVLACFLRIVFLRGRPIGSGTKASTSDRRTSIRPPISRADRRFRRISLAMACLDTPRIRAASACEIQSSKSSSLMVDVDTYFCYHLLQLVVPVPL